MMKKNLIALFAMLSVCVALKTETADAQVRGTSAENVPLQYMKGNLYQNGIKLTSKQALNILGQETYSNMYEPAKAMRISGIVLVSVGSASFCLGACLHFIPISQKSITGIIVTTMPSFIFISSGIVAATAGGILWGLGDKKMKKIVPASSGAGLALVF